MPKPEPFDDENLEALAKIIAEHRSNSGIVRLFERSGFPQITEYTGGTKWCFVLEAFRDMQSEADSAESVLVVLKSLCHPGQYAGKREELDKLVETVNDVLQFQGLRLIEDGRILELDERVRTVPYTKTEDELAFERYDFHPAVVQHAYTPFRRGFYSSSVVECCKVLDGVIRSSTGVEKSGVSLMSEALSSKGAIRLNRYESASEKDEQVGFMYFCMGLMAAIRNPHSHEPALEWSLGRQDALDLLGFISFIFRKLETANVLTPSGGVARIEIKSD